MANSTTNRQEDEMEQAPDATGQEERIVYTDFGKGPKGTTVANLVNLIEPNIATAPKFALKRYRDTILAARKSYRQRYGGEEHPAIERLRRRINRAIVKLKETAGTTPAPNALIRNTHYTRQLLLDWEIYDAESEEPITAPELDERYRDILASRPAGLIIDAIETYVRDYFDNGASDAMQLNEQGRYYVIRDSFDNFCYRAGVHGEDRRVVKEALFPPVGKAGLLERVGFILPRKGKRYGRIIRFVSARYINTVTRVNRLDNEGETVVDFEMDINARLFDFLEYRSDIVSGRGKGKFSEGYQDIPRALNGKINRLLTFSAEKLAEAGGWPRAVGRSTERFRKAIFFLIDQWNTGKKARKEDMVVRWADLSKLGILPAHSRSTRRHRRYEDMSALCYLVQYLHRDEEAFSGCEGIELVNKPLSLVFRVKAGK